MEQQLSVIIEQIKLSLEANTDPHKAKMLQRASASLQEILACAKMSGLETQNGVSQKFISALTDLSTAALIDSWKAQQRALLTPELKAWALSQINEEEIMAGLRDIEQNGGLELKDFIHELEEVARTDE